MIEKACFFSGHRIIPKNDEILTSRLREEILNKINDKVNVFIAGGAIGFDTLAAEQILDMKKDYSRIRLHLYLPCIDQDRLWNSADRERFNRIKEVADKIVYVTNAAYTDGCMKKRNLAMVEASDCGIVYLLHTNNSGSAQTVKMAHEKGLEITNLADE